MADDSERRGNEGSEGKVGEGVVNLSSSALDPVILNRGELTSDGLSAPQKDSEEEGVEIGALEEGGREGGTEVVLVWVGADFAGLVVSGDALGESLRNSSGSS